MGQDRKSFEIGQFVAFYILIYAIFYGVYFLIYEFLQNSGMSPKSSPIIGIAMWGIPLLLSFLVCVLFSRKYEGKFTFRFIGLRREGFLVSYLIASASGFASMLFLVAEIKTLGFGSVGSSIISAGFVFKPIYLSIPYSALLFLIISFLAYSIWMAYPLRLVHRLPTTKGRLLIVPVLILWIILFDQTLLTSQIEPGDLILFDLLFAFLFIRYGNAYGLIAGYLASGEWIVMAIPASLGEAIFDFVLYVRIGIALLSIAILAFLYLSGGKNIFSRPSNT